MKTYDRNVQLRNERYSAAIAPDGLPVPDAILRVRVAGTADIESFLYGGELGAQTVRNLVRTVGRRLEDCHAILDFGCGCGRVLRHWKHLTRTAVFGTDLDLELVRWCGEQLPFASVSVNSEEPPLSFADETFDLIYAFSVFTHLPEGVQKRWLDEFHRKLRVGGLLIFSTHGSYYVDRLNNEERHRFGQGELVVRYASAAGSNLCNSYHPESFVRQELAYGWEVLTFVPEGARGNPQQDAWVFRRP